MRALVWALPAAALLSLASGVRADEQAVALVVESDLDALQLRGAVARKLGRPVTTLSRAQASLDGPPIVLTVSVDREVGISVMYWDREGAEWLSAPMPATAEATREVAAALAAALVQQHERRERRANLVPAENPYLLPKAPAKRPRSVSPANPYYQRRARGG